MKTALERTSFGGRIKQLFLSKMGWIESGVCAAVAFLMANAFLFNTMAPFGVSFAASVKREHGLAAAAGAILGYTFSYNPTSNVKYIIAVVLTLAANWVITDTKLVKHRGIAVPVITLLAVLASDFAVLSIGGLTLYDAVLSLSEGALAGGVTFFIMRTLSVADRRENLVAISKSDLSCLIITFAVAMMALGSFTVAGLSVGRVASVVVILLCAKYGQESAGAVAGVTAGAAMGLLGGELTYLAASYGFGGLVAGMFSTFGGFGCAVVFVIVNGIVSLVMGGRTEVLSSMYEVFAASVIFVLIPGSWTDKLMLARRGKVEAVTQTAKNIMLGKLHFASHALSDISTTTQQVSGKLMEMQNVDISSVYSKSVDTACRKCKQRGDCWGSNFSESMDSLNHLGAALKRKGKIFEQDIGGRLGEVCVRKPELAIAVNAEYSVFTQRQGSRRRVSQIRGVVTDQFEGMAMLLDTLADDLSQIYEVDNRKNRCIVDLFQRNNTELTSASSYEDRFGRLYVEVDLPAFKLARLPVAEITAELSDLCETTFDLPVVRQAEGSANLLFAEKAALSAEYGRVQIPYGDSKLCGDCGDFLLDNRGRAHMILSDGMGSGGKAAIDAAMTVSLFTKLIGAGFEYDAALKMVNSALLVKSNEESLSTVDIACVDLYTGKTEFLKAGAAPSFVLRSGTVGKVESMSMPAGILRGVEFEKSTMTLREGDVIVMISDGVILTGVEWLYPQIKLSRDRSAQEMAQEIAETAKLRRTDSHDDDITVSVLKLGRGVS
ncbi:SpoIIE family protein phosphatase [Ligaoa zhengdingensis]|uniref:SpoIIE family protein phosphatase n=1 Tax=Ligaoa zhengdingensis TaxID=2763658 RepID=UPI0031BA61E5